MTDRLQALIDLRDKVKKGGSISAGCMESMGLACGFDLVTATSFIHVYRGDLNAALAMHEAVLPGWTMDQMNQWHQNGQGSGWFVSLLYHGTPKRRARCGEFDITPARAWLLAILEALIGMEQ